MLLLERLQALGEARPSLADRDRRRALQAAAQLPTGGREDLLRQHALADGRQHLGLDQVRGDPPLPAADARAAVVATLTSALDMGLGAVLPADGTSSSGGPLPLSGADHMAPSFRPARRSPAAFSTGSGGGEVSPSSAPGPCARLGFLGVAPRGRRSGHGGERHEPASAATEVALPRGSRPNELPAD
jgi:hypothetical protein